MTPTINLKPGLRVLVTAGASGIGLAIAKTFAAADARVHICDIDEDAMAKIAADYPDWGVSRCNVADAKQVAEMFARIVADWDGLDVLVNNAGIAGPTADIDKITVAEWCETVNVNLNGQFYCANLAAPLLRKSDDASIICISSVAGRLGYARRAPYAATKWGIIGLVKSLAIELGPDGIRVNALLPGVVQGPRIDRVIRAHAEVANVPFEDIERQYIKKASLRRMVTAQDVANQALLLCSPLSSNISGQSISVCGNVEYL